VQVSNGSCGTTYSTVGQVILYGTSICEWTGAVSNVWSVTGNWCAGIVGSSGRSVEIRTSATNDPTLDANYTIANLDFNASSRKVILAAYNLTVDAIKGADSVNYVKTNAKGVLKKSIANGARFTFEVGQGAYNPVRITNNTGSSDLFSARVFDTVYYKGTTGYTSTQPRVNRTWDISKTNANAGSGIDFLFNWNYGESINLDSGHALNHFESGAWAVKSSGVTTKVDNSLSYTGYTGTFSPFGIGRGTTPLPMKFIDYEVIQSNENAILTWTTQADAPHYYNIYKSIDGLSWTLIGKTNGSNTNNGIKQYQFVDQNVQGNKFYKISMVNLENGSESSVFLALDGDADANDINLYPNPNNGDFTISTKQHYAYNIINVQGITVLNGEVNGILNINNLDKGLYTVLFYNEYKTYIIKFIVK
jgi:hypothetical protein